MLSLEWPPDRFGCLGSFAELRELGVPNVSELCSFGVK